MPELTYQRLPLAMRVSQRSMMLGIAILIGVRFVRRLQFPWLWILVISISSAFALVSLFSASYVVIRYPFLGLVDLKDGDLFSKYFTQRKRWLWTFLNVLVIITIAIILAAIGFSLFAGPVKLGARDVFILTFFVLEMAFLVFLLGWYDRVQHPTVATFIWATLGIGILLAPFYLPAILIGSYRCKRLLDSVDVEGAVRDGDLRGF